MTAAAIAKPAQIMMLARSTLFGPLLEPQKVALQSRSKVRPNSEGLPPTRAIGYLQRALTMGVWRAVPQQPPRTIF